MQLTTKHNGYITFLIYLGYVAPSIICMVAAVLFKQLFIHIVLCNSLTKKHNGIFTFTRLMIKRGGHTITTGLIFILAQIFGVPLHKRNLSFSLHSLIAVA